MIQPATRDRKLTIRLRPHEQLAIERAAEAEAERISEWARRKLMLAANSGSPVKRKRNKRQEA